MKQGQSSTPADILVDNFIAMIPIDCNIANFPTLVCLLF